MRRFLKLFVCVPILSLAGSAQTANSAQTADRAPDSKTQSKPAPGASKDRLFYALPNFLTLENASQAPPLTSEQKFKVTLRSSFDPIELFWHASLAGIEQAGNSEPGYGQGMEGYAKRFASHFADGTIENVMTSAVVPSLLHQDPRYFQSGKGSFWRRSGYAISRLVVTRTDSGQSQFNYSEIFGSAASASISTFTYHPRGDRYLGNAASVWASEIGWDALSFAIKEFWPDIRRKIHKPKPAATTN